MSQRIKPVIKAKQNLHQGTSGKSRKMLYKGSLMAVLGSTAMRVFLELGEDVWLREVFAWDAPTMLAIHSLQTPRLDWFMKASTMAGSYGATIVTVAVALKFRRRRHKDKLAALLVSVVGAATMNGLLKMFFARPRPSVFPPFSVEHTYSFPSGHTITAVALYGYLAILLWPEGYRLLALLVGSLIPIVGFSRIYLGVHYPSDILGAMALGTLWVLLVVAGLAWYRHNHQLGPKLWNSASC